MIALNKLLIRSTVIIIQPRNFTKKNTYYYHRKLEHMEMDFWKNTNDLEENMKKLEEDVLIGRSPNLQDQS